MKTLTVVGRRWFDRRYGNTYHTCQILIDGEIVYASGMHYGYDRAYEQTAAEWLIYTEKLICRDSQGRSLPLWAACRDAGIAFVSTASDVARKRDLAF